MYVIQPTVTKDWKFFVTKASDAICFIVEKTNMCTQCYDYAIRDGGLPESFISTPCGSYLSIQKIENEYEFYYEDLHRHYTVIIQTVAGSDSLSDAAEKLGLSRKDLMREWTNANNFMESAWKTK